MLKSMAGTALILICVGVAGCSKEKISELVDQAKDKAAAGVDQASQALHEKAQAASNAASAASSSAQQQLGLAGSIEFTLDASVKTKGCYVAFIPGGGGRPSILQLRSYPSAVQESFPSAFVQAQVQAQTLGELAGQTVPAQAFIQAESSSPVWHTADGEPLQLTITSVVDRQVAGELSGAAVSTATGQSAPVSGRIEGWLE